LLDQFGRGIGRAHSQTSWSDIIAFLFIVNPFCSGSNQIVKLEQAPHLQNWRRFIHYGYPYPLDRLRLVLTRSEFLLSEITLFTDMVNPCFWCPRVGGRRVSFNYWEDAPFRISSSTTFGYNTDIQKPMIRIASYV